MSLNELVRWDIENTGRMVDLVLQDVTPEEAVKRPSGLAPVVWQLGHLAVADGAIAQALSGDDGLVPDRYKGLFARGTAGDGPFPPLAEVKDVFARIQARLLELAGGDLERPVDGGRLYATAGQALLFANRHRWYHIGKIMTLRALLDKPRLM
ncbi:MAG: DinB family protein [Firmicutes bacterium]|nr:DinB family protein [Bacillota bacterium]